MTVAVAESRSLWIPSPAAVVAPRRSLRLVVTYAGARGAEAALDELRWAGLPREVDVLFAVPRSLADEPVAGRRPRPFPWTWRVRTEALPGIALVGEEALRAAEAWKADLILVGSQGSRPLNPPYFGCISAHVAAKAHCSVRIARTGLRAHATSPRILVGVDGSAGSREAVRAITARVWPRGADARIVAVEARGTWPRDSAAALEQAAAALRSAGLEASTEVRFGEPWRELLVAARERGSDCIFVGAPASPGRADPDCPTSVAIALAAHAPCSVEVARPARTAVDAAPPLEAVAAGA